MTSNNDKGPREFDVILWGASGFTGQLVAQALLRRQDGFPELRWAVAGRNREKLCALRKQLGPKAAQIQILVANSDNLKSLLGLAAKSTVMVSTVGPYARYGDLLVRACVDQGTHYCDLAGEVQWMRSMIDQYQESARKSGARIVHSCGFDSIPSDIGVQLLQQESRQRHGAVCESVLLLVKVMRGGPSGGTVASLLTAIEQARNDRQVARILADPYALNPAAERSGPDGRDQRSVVYSSTARTWTAPFVMAAVNTRIVRRTNALLDYPYGRSFRYREATMTGDGLAGRSKAFLQTAGLGAFMMAASSETLRSSVLKRFLPRPGDGPDQQERENGFFVLKLFGTTSTGETVEMTVSGDQDPGYGSTSKMLTESALCLAKDTLSIGGGFWTPASALGQPLADRLISHAGLSFKCQ